ncbi:MAG: chorismate mutase [Rhodospirillaceae bacterium]|nr:MAG: chorismate mutase [Rhodospirillaceae bacterium]
MTAKDGKDGAKSETEGDWRDGCTSLADVRANIDRLDALIVPLMCERHRFVTAAAKFKPSVEGVVVVSRVEEIVRKVRDIAAAEKVNPDTIEAVYRAMIDAFTRDEQAHWRKLHK